ncbi:MAG: hypothetical protein PWP37_501 [Thermotogota bacterium]|nr:hypothetical protein [Thermotogota bacterium]
MKKVIPSKMRKIIASTTAEVFKEAPHYHVTVKIEARGIFEQAQKNEVKPVDVVIYHVARLLKEYELLNGYWQEDVIYLYDEVNVGYIVAVDDGMLVPVIRRADELTIKEIYTKRRDFVSRTLAHKLLPDEYKGGTFTISNLGIFPVEIFTGVLYKNQSGLLTLGRFTTEKPCKITLVCDHRLVDGYYAARFLTELKERLEKGEENT